MLRFILGIVAGGVTMWMWRDELQGYVDRRTRSVRVKAADQLRTVQKAAESVLDTAKEQIRAGLETTQEVIRPSEGKATAIR